MKTFEAQKAFFDARWPELKDAARAGGAPAVLALIDAQETDLQRRVLHLFARQGFVLGDWDGEDPTLAAAVARGSIDRLVEEARQVRADGDEDGARKRLELANVISYNLAADLADCWPGERPARSEVLFEEGLKAAEDCIAWREELAKGPGASSMAWWAKGMHLLSLGRADEARQAFFRSLGLARDVAQSDEDFGVVLGRGYVGLARWVAGDEEGREELQAALDVFEHQLADADTRDDARFGIDQLETVRQRYAPAESA